MLGAEPGSQWTLGNVVSALPPGARTRPGGPRFHFLLPFAQKRTDFMEQLILNTNLGNGGAWKLRERPGSGTLMMLGWAGVIETVTVKTGRPFTVGPGARCHPL